MIYGAGEFKSQTLHGFEAAQSPTFIASPSTRVAEGFDRPPRSAGRKHRPRASAAKLKRNFALHTEESEERGDPFSSLARRTREDKVSKSIVADSMV